MKLDYHMHLNMALMMKIGSKDFLIVPKTMD